MGKTLYSQLLKFAIWNREYADFEDS
jgi:hypothetical protein